MPTETTLNASQMSALRFEFVRRDSRLTCAQRIVVIDVLDHDFAVRGQEGRGRKAEAWPSQTRLEGRLSISRRSIYDAIRKAEDLGYWRLERMRGKPHKRWKFKIDYERINEWALKMVEGDGRDCSLLREQIARECGKPLPTNLPNSNSPITTSRTSAPASRARGTLAGSRPDVVVELTGFKAPDLERRPIAKKARIGPIRVIPEDQEDFERYKQLKRRGVRPRRPVVDPD